MNDSDRVDAEMSHFSLKLLATVASWPQSVLSYGCIQLEYEEEREAPARERIRFIVDDNISHIPVPLHFPPLFSLVLCSFPSYEPDAFARNPIICIFPSSQPRAKLAPEEIGTAIDFVLAYDVSVPTLGSSSSSLSRSDFSGTGSLTKIYSSYARSIPRSLCIGIVYFV